MGGYAMRLIKVILLGIITLSLMGIGPLFGKNTIDDKTRSSYMINCIVDGRLVGAGSGNHFSHRGQRFILTAYHVIEECEDVYVIEYDGNIYVLNTVIYDKMLDWAVLKPQKQLKLKPAKFKRTYPSLGEPIDMVSWPSDYGMVYTKGIVSGQQYLSFYVQTFCWLGSSGSSIFTENGEFIGVLHGIKVGFYSSVGDAQLLNNMCLVRPLASVTDKELFEALRDYDGGEARHITY
jgi:S1-C subfamily serine protease